ncbi:hypothetical protein [Brevibacillus laterosporus]|uniref:hypothetical protein n=1 Tax=Brevibacillus laterosporus TaxID=1465 RepID=UPI0013C523E6|nr:hypothetical protein [Brevibacillus laterosporus]MCR8937586.1 hypothetical protein [Brevibacillus laterosporus]MCZ0840225.1 hypothetical protein [Brevibacillus laterosporus]MCZ0844021.1 hypothetical protein [Brevibacillus laterosporus]
MKCKNDLKIETDKQSVGRVNSNTLFVYATVYRFVCQAEMSDKLHNQLAFQSRFT